MNSVVSISTAAYCERGGNDLNFNARFYKA